MQAKGRSGKHLNHAIYGYRDDPNTKGLWLIDEETAPVVKRMFDLTLAGKGTQQIAEILEREKVLNPTAVSDIRRGKNPRKEPYRWNNNTVRMMLRHKEYAGYTVNFKTYSKSYKLKKRLANNPENILEIPDTQKAIVPLTQWELAQELLDKKRILAVSKCDLIDEDTKKEIKKHLPKKVPHLFISSATGEGIKELKDLIWLSLTD